MKKESTLYPFMSVCMNGVINGILNIDGEYQEFIRKFDAYDVNKQCQNHYSINMVLVNNCVGRCVLAASECCVDGTSSLPKPQC